MAEEHKYQQKLSFVEYQAVILAGGDGSKLYPLTDGTPKALVKVANRPLLSFPVELLQSCGFKEVIVVTVDNQHKEIKRVCSELSNEKIRIHLEVVEDYCGTADALRQIAPRLHHDVLVVSCDLITDVFLHYLADIHRSRDAAVTVLLKTQAEKPLSKKKSKADSTSQQHYIALDDTKQSRLVYFRAIEDIEDDLLKVSKSLLARYPSVTFSGSLHDAHCYILSKWVIDLLKTQPDISSVQGELIPYLVTNQFSSKKDLLNCIPLNPQGLALHMTSSPFRGPPGGPRDPMRPPEKDEDPIRCFAFVAPSNAYCRRAQTLEDYIRMNDYVARGPVSDMTPWTPVRSTNHNQQFSKESKVQIGKQVLLGSDLIIGESSSLKRSIIGKHCKIGNKVRINNSIIMDYVTIEDGCNIKDSVICDQANISTKTSLDTVFVATNFTTEEGGTHRKETLHHATVVWE